MELVSKCHDSTLLLPNTEEVKVAGKQGWENEADEAKDLLSYSSGVYLVPLHNRPSFPLWTGTRLTG